MAKKKTKDSPKKKTVKAKGKTPTKTEEGKVQFVEVLESMTLDEKITAHSHNLTLLFYYIQSLAGNVDLGDTDEVLLVTSAKLNLAQAKIMLISKIIAGLNSQKEMIKKSEELSDSKAEINQ
jgi:hypothetical protein